MNLGVKTPPVHVECIDPPRSEPFLEGEFDRLLCPLPPPDMSIWGELDCATLLDDCKPLSTLIGDCRGVVKSGCWMLCIGDAVPWTKGEAVGVV